MIFNNLFSRLSRPFTASARLSIAPESSVATTSIPEGAQRCTVAAGCYWGTEYLYRKHFSGKGLIDAKVGFIGGDLTNPSYRAVCGGKTGRKFLSYISSFLYNTLPITNHHCNRRRGRRDHL